MNKFLFYLSARLFGEACLELFIYRITPEGKKQVYLLPRPNDDPFYANMLHLPGARKIPTETDEETLRRAIKETPFVPKEIEYLFPDTYKAKRGVEFADVRSFRVDYRALDHNHFYSVDSLPDNLIEHHRKIIERIVQK